jgi:hypothetical protein
MPLVLLKYPRLYRGFAQYKYSDLAVSITSLLALDKFHALSTPDNSYDRFSALDLSIGRNSCSPIGAKAGATVCVLR